MRIGVCGLFFFIVGYARFRNVLLFSSVSETVSFHAFGAGVDLPHRSAVLRRLAEQEAHLLEALCEGVPTRHAGRTLCAEGFGDAGAWKGDDC